MTDFDRLHADLLVALTELVDLLEAHGETRWSRSLRRCRNGVAGFDANALKALRGMYGGMGSIRDLVIHPANGDSIAESAVSPVNERLNELLSRVWTDVRDMLDELGAGPR